MGNEKCITLFTPVAFISCFALAPRSQLPVIIDFNLAISIFTTGSFEILAHFLLQDFDKASILVLIMSQPILCKGSCNLKTTRLLMSVIVSLFILKAEFSTKLPLFYSFPDDDLFGFFFAIIRT